MRPPLVLALAVLLSGCASTAPRSPREDVAQFVIAVRACLPAWFVDAPTLDAYNLRTTTLFVASGDFRSFVMAPYACVLSAGSDCEAVRACYGLESEATSGPCMGAPPRCDRDTLLVCIPASDPFPTQIGRVDCARDGRSCVEDESSGVLDARCLSAACTSVTPFHCEGVDAVGCDGMFETREQAPPGTTCTESGRFAHFVGDGEPCTSHTCAGDVLHECDFETHRTRSSVDCGLLGATCSVELAQCVPGPSDCLARPSPSCVNGSVVQYCGVDGRTHDYDCVAHGFAGCDERFAPDRGISTAGCAPTGARF